MADQTYWDDLNEGDEVTLTEAMSSQRLVVWAAASGDFYQIHYDDDFAKGNNLPDIIVHGALKGMLVGRLLDELCGDEGTIKQWDVSYRGMDIARHDVVVHGAVTKKYEEGGQHLLDLNVGVRTDEGNRDDAGHGDGGATLEVTFALDTNQTAPVSRPGLSRSRSSDQVSRFAQKA